MAPSISSNHPISTRVTSPPPTSNFGKPQPPKNVPLPPKPVNIPSTNSVPAKPKLFGAVPNSNSTSVQKNMDPPKTEAIVDLIDEDELALLDYIEENYDVSPKKNANPPVKPEEEFPMEDDIYFEPPPLEIEDELPEIKHPTPIIYLSEYFTRKQEHKEQTVQIKVSIRLEDNLSNL